MMEGNEVSYEEVGNSCGLDLETLDLFTRYMRYRWGDTEKQKCADGYAREWALRFLDGIEFEMSDIFGKRALYELDTVKYEFKYLSYSEQEREALFQDLKRIHDKSVRRDNEKSDI